MLGRTALAISLVILVACSDDTDGTSSTSPTTTTTTGGSGGDGAGGTATGATGGSGGTMLEVQCGNDPVFTSHFNCDVSALTDMTSETDITIGYGYDGSNFVYEPKCVHVCRNARITFEPIDGTDFNIHPLQGGAPPGDPDSPFGYVLGDHQTETFTMTETGSFPYYCDAHISANMTGAIYVQ